MNNALKMFAALLLVSCGFVPQSHAQMSEMQSDRAHRDRTIQWPAGHDPSVAPVFSHNELPIHADRHRTFARLANAVDWPKWLVIVKDVANETPGKTGQGALYRLKIFNSPIQSRVVEFEPDQRISWIPFGPDETESATATITPGISFRRPHIAWS